MVCRLFPAISPCKSWNERADAGAPGAELQKAFLLLLMHNFPHTFPCCHDSQPLNISPLGNGSKAYGLGMISTEGTHCSPGVSHPWPGQPTHCWQLVTDGVLITTLGTRLGCVQAPCSVSWLCILVEVFGMELGLKASREQSKV